MKNLIYKEEKTKMKNFLTKAFVCAGVLASALALSSVAVFAATYTPNSKDFTSTDGVVVCNGNAYTADVGVKLNPNTKATVTEGEYIKIKANPGDKITIIPRAASNNSSVTIKLVGLSSSTVYGTAITCTVGKTSTDTVVFEPALTSQTDVYLINDSGTKNPLIYQIDVSAENDTYTWTVDTSALTGDFASITATDFTITESEDKQSAKIIYKGTAFDTTANFYDSETDILASDTSKVKTSYAPISGTEFNAYTYAIKLTDNMFAVKSSKKSFDATTLTVSDTSQTSEALGAEELEGFTPSGTVNKRNQEGSNTVYGIDLDRSNGKLTFFANKGDVIKFTFSSNGNSNTAIATLVKSTTLVTSETTGTSSAKKTFAIIAPSTGEYTIQAGTGSRNLRLYSGSVTPASEFSLADTIKDVSKGKIVVSGTNVYLIAAISETEAANSNLNLLIGTYKKNFDTGYQTVKIGSTEYTAASFNAAALYGVKISGVNGAQVEVSNFFDITK